MSNNVKTLPGIVAPGKPNEKVIELLEETLEKARKGEILSVALVTIGHEQEVNTSWQHQAQLFALIGGVAWLQHRLVAG